MNGMIRRGISLSMHTPIRDITLVCSNDNIVDTSLASLSRSTVENSARVFQLYIFLDKSQNEIDLPFPVFTATSWFPTALLI